MNAGPVIRYRNTWKAFNHPVLSGVDLDIHEGEMFALFGPSGTGKSVQDYDRAGGAGPGRRGGHGL